LIHRQTLRAVVLLGWTLGATAAPSPFTPDDLVRLERISDPQVSADGRQVAYVQRSTDMEANRGRTDIYLVALPTGRGTDAPPPRRLTSHPENDASPRWLPDGRALLFLSERSGSSQVWRLSLDGGEAQQVTDYALDVGTFRIAPDGRSLVLTMEVFPDCADLACSKRRLDEKPKGTGKRFEQLFMRHWDRWEDGSFSHLFTATLGTDGKAGTPRDLITGVRAHVPSRPFGGDEEYSFSADGSEVLWSMRLASPTEPWSTNFDLYSAPLRGTQAPRNLTADNLAWDTQPRSLRDGSLVWLAMSRPGFEADRFRIMVRAPDGRTRELAPDWQLSPDALAIGPNGREVLAAADDHGRRKVFAVDLRSGAVRALNDSGSVSAFSPTPGGVVAALADLNAPPELFELRGREQRVLTRANAALLAERLPAEYQQFSFAGAGGDTVYGYVVKPQGVPAGQRAPVAFIVHGGPQSNMGDNWSFRSNPKVYAAAGFAVVFIDFHGSTGYGQKFTDSISGDWGGKPFEDLQKGLAAALGRFDFLDGERVCALGASYGGYMMNWIAGHWPERFKCIVNHAGIFDSRGMYYTTEELWFEEWEHQGTAFENPANYERFNPVLAVDKWRTPMLVIHGQLDYRVPYSQGIATFTALQRRGIESRLLIFPDENHWILKPANSLQWHAEVLGWLREHLKPAAEPRLASRTLPDESTSATTASRAPAPR
jgi:dipeptidyl aminopeptidase/acylaminoacyl peptidase